MAENERVVLSAEQIEKRVRELARQIAHDFHGDVLHVVTVVDSGFVFMADLVRMLDCDVVCHFIRPDFTEIGNTTEIFYSPEPDVNGADVLLVETLIQSGVTSEFLMRNLLARGAARVKLVTLLDRQAARRVSLQPDYFGFLIDEPFVFGYGLGDPRLGRNLPYIASRAGAAGTTI
ncbi:MAG: phosphoribosyltransferase [Terriglobales bacterium]